jgi:hypothetical protein
MTWLNDEEESGQVQLKPRDRLVLQLIIWYMPHDPLRLNRPPDHLQLLKLLQASGDTDANHKEQTNRSAVRLRMQQPPLLIIPPKNLRQFNLIPTAHGRKEVARWVESGVLKPISQALEKKLLKAVADFHATQVQG